MLHTKNMLAATSRLEGVPKLVNTKMKTDQDPDYFLFALEKYHNLLEMGQKLLDGWNKVITFRALADKEEEVFRLHYTQNTAYTRNAKNLSWYSDKLVPSHGIAMKATREQHECNYWNRDGHVVNDRNNLKA